MNKSFCFHYLLNKNNFCFHNILNKNDAVVLDIMFLDNVIVNRNTLSKPVNQLIYYA